MNPRTRQAALYAIGVIAILASANALAHSYAGLYEWAVHHRLTGWQARSWPAEIDVFLAVGEFALYVAYLDGWPARQRIWPWATALTGLGVSIAGNVGHIQPVPGHPVMLADRLTAAAGAADRGSSAGGASRLGSRDELAPQRHQAGPGLAARCQRDLPGRGRARAAAQPADAGPPAAQPRPPFPQRAPALHRRQHRAHHGQGRVRRR